MLGEKEYADLHPGSFELDFRDLEADEGYNAPKDFLTQVLPLEAGGAIPWRGGKWKLWYEYASPLEKDWDLQRQEETQLQLQLAEEIQRPFFEEWHRELQDIQRQRADQEGTKRRKESRQEDEWQRQQQEQEDYLDAMWANASTSERELGRWGRPDDDTPTHSSSFSPAREDELKEHHVHVKMYEYDGNDIPRYRLFKSEVNVQELLLGYDLKIPYYIHAGRCNLNFEGYVLRYADLFPSFYSWKCTWVFPTTYEGDDDYVDFFGELMGQVDHTNTKDRVLAKAIAIASNGFRKILYFQIEVAVEDCMVLLEDKKKMDQRCEIYGFLASQVRFEEQEYESVLERITDGREALRYDELAELGSDADEDHAFEMRELVDRLVRSTPKELTSPGHAYHEWVAKQIRSDFYSDFNLYVERILEKLSMAETLGLVPEDTS